MDNFTYIYTRVNGEDWSSIREGEESMKGKEKEKCVCRLYIGVRKRSSVTVYSETFFRPAL